MSRALALLVSAVLLAACTGGSAGGSSNTSAQVVSAYSPAKAKTGGSLAFSDYQQLSDLDVLTANDEPTIEATNEIFASLWSADPENRFVPDLASVVPTAENGMVKRLDSTRMDVRIRLKKGLKWSDGTDLTTQDVLFTWQAICDPSINASTTLGFDHIASMDITSPTEMTWHFGPDPTGKRCGLTSPLASGVYGAYLTLGYFPMAPLPEHVLSRYPHSQWATLPYFLQKPTVVSGPFQVQSFTGGSSAKLVLAANPEYSAGRDGSRGFNHGPYLQQLTYSVYPDKATEIASMKAGQDDLALGLVARDVPTFQNAQNLQIKAATGTEYEMVLFNVGTNEKTCAAQHFAAGCGQPTIFANDSKLRQALSLAADRSTMNSKLVEGIGRPLYCLFPSQLKPWHDVSFCDGSHDYSAALRQANSLLEADGWKAGSDGIRVKAGNRCEFRLSAPDGDPQRALEAQQLAANWRQVGCSAVADYQPSALLFDTFIDGGLLATGQFDAALVAENFAPDPDSWSQLALASQVPSETNAAGANWGRWQDSRLQSLFAHGAGEVSVARRQAIYNDVQREWENYAGAVELYERPQIFVFDSHVGNLFPNANVDLGSWNAVDWYRKS